MDKFFSLFFKDPILMIVGLLLAVTIAILLWAISKLKSFPAFPEDMPDENPESYSPPAENGGLNEARIQEISNQLSEINNKIDKLEKTLTLASAKAPAAGNIPDLQKLEQKIEGIHKLLIVLTDSGSPDQK